jgi:hypothetical protein
MQGADLCWLSLPRGQAALASSLGEAQARWVHQQSTCVCMACCCSVGIALHGRCLRVVHVTPTGQLQATFCKTVLTVCNYMTIWCVSVATGCHQPPSATIFSRVVPQRPRRGFSEGAADVGLYPAPGARLCHMAAQEECAAATCVCRWRGADDTGRHSGEP